MIHVQCLACLLFRTLLIRCEHVTAEALLTMTMSDQRCALDFAESTQHGPLEGEKPGAVTTWEILGSLRTGTTALCWTQVSQIFEKYSNYFDSLLFQQPVFIAHLR